jgi:hypothetical protein
VWVQHQRLVSARLVGLRSMTRARGGANAGGRTGRGEGREHRRPKSNSVLPGPIPNKDAEHSLGRVSRTPRLTYSPPPTTTLAWMHATMQLSLEWLFHPGSCTSGAPRRTWQVNSRMPCSCRQAGRAGGAGVGGRVGQGGAGGGWGAACRLPGGHILLAAMQPWQPCLCLPPACCLTPAHLRPWRRLLVLWNDDNGWLADGGLRVLVGGGLQAPRHLRGASRQADSRAIALTLAD